METASRTRLPVLGVVCRLSIPSPHGDLELLDRGKSIAAALAKHLSTLVRVAVLC